MAAAEEPVAGPLYDAVAAALAPFVVGGRVNLTYPRIVAEVAATIAGRDQDWDRRCARLRRQLGECRSEAAARHKVIERVLAKVSAERLEATLLRAAELDSARQAAARMAERAGRLEAIVVQARARWDHDGGPEVLRAAFASLEEVSP